MPLYPAPPESLVSPSLRQIATYIGPGVIIASVTIGSGELVYASRSGAIFGYSLLWCFLYAGLFKGIQVYTAARHITLTGEHPMVVWRSLPGPPLWFPLLIALPAVALMPIAFSAIPETLAGYIHRLSGMSLSGEPLGAWGHLEFWINAWSTLLLVICLGLALGSSYTILERVSAVVLAGIVLSVGIAVFVFGPDLLQFVMGLLVPSRPVYPSWLLESSEYAKEFRGRSEWLEVSIYLGAVGGGAYDYIGYIGMLREKEWGLAGGRVATRAELEAAVSTENESAAVDIERAGQWVRAPLFDTAASFACVVLVTLLFATLGTLVLNREQRVPANNDLLNAQETFLSALHPELRWLYRLGVFLAFIGTLYGAFDVYRHTLTEAARSIAPRFVTVERLPKIRVVTYAYCLLGGLTMIWLPEKLAGTIIDRLTFGSILSGAASCGLWCFAMLWADQVRLPLPLRMSRALQFLTFLAGVAMTTLGVITTLEYFRAA